MQVRIYWNLHKKMFSVVDKETNKVVYHTQDILLKNCRFIVRQGGRKKVLETKRKNVHAFVEGTVTGLLTKDHMDFYAVSYNPYRYDSFVKLPELTPLANADYVLGHAGKLFALTAKE